MKSNDEIFDIVLSRRDEYERKKRTNRRRITALAAAAVAVTAIVLTAVAAQRNNLRRTVSAPTGTQESISTQAENLSALKPESAAETSANTPEQPGTKADPRETTTFRESILEGGESGGIYIPVIPESASAPAGVKITGEPLTDEEAKAYFESDGVSIVNALSASGVNTDDIRFSSEGYCHVSYDGTMGKPLECRQNFRDYPVCNGSDLVAIVTLVKENGKIYSTPAFGSPWFGSYNAFLSAHKGQKLLYVYAGAAEIIIAPDGTCYNPQGIDTGEYFSLPDPYNYFYCEQATFTP